MVRADATDYVTGEGDQQEDTEDADDPDAGGPHPHVRGRGDTSQDTPPEDVSKARNVAFEKLLPDRAFTLADGDGHEHAQHGEGHEQRFGDVVVCSTHCAALEEEPREEGENRGGEEADQVATEAASNQEGGNRDECAENCWSEKDCCRDLLAGRVTQSQDEGPCGDQLIEEGAELTDILSCGEASPDFVGHRGETVFDTVLDRPEVIPGVVA